MGTVNSGVLLFELLLAFISFIVSNIPSSEDSTDNIGLIIVCIIISIPIAIYERKLSKVIVDYEIRTEGRIIPLPIPSDIEFIGIATFKGLANYGFILTLFDCFQNNAN